MKKAILGLVGIGLAVAGAVVGAQEQRNSLASAARREEEAEKILRMNYLNYYQVRKVLGIY